ncbi:hypothetical protein GobsT_38500 [Gemmata obscuriglobus]|uniref:DUF1415 domain-containing protein n=1 Tax=Gemmata obscuriglobus TaxID=114 RepID=A0A2Z3H4M2_9BACT|nr:DUF1415 domain-containing protein [Gemmata obscuriglobus]AWM38065.1 DUF1415 domain-containing protein [Gemmata obscuriglobus]QEG29061.1 hypothetical protein GobsT_38500 [Gemmata obscuriglobus]VTS07697.1 DUF1415 domain containing protein OS=Lysobacter dokdonensis DS-58 GN=LF41_1497 PE=4 SV=1: DUF1415 [Gemmata obscuriglobus UQM 2246]
MDPEAAIAATRRWIQNAVIELNLCPFARRVFDGGLIRYAVTDATDTAALTVALTEQLRALAAAPAEEVETAFLIHPNALADFFDYNDFVAGADELIAELGLEGVIQIASFHPLYQFAGTRPDDVENYTNRSPFPMLHLLREESISRVNDDPEKLLDIPKRNIETLRKLGRTKLLALVNRGPG